jgi:hypothetical protein
MECTCIKEIEGKVLEAHPTWNDKKVESVRMDRVYAFEDNQTTIRTSTNLVVTVENQKKKYDVGITHTYCPFCGVKQIKETLEQPEIQ